MVIERSFQKRLSAPLRDFGRQSSDQTNGLNVRVTLRASFR
jgi:hypothetical protein